VLLLALLGLLAQLKLGGVMVMEQELLMLMKEP